jgi:predicted permease
MYNIFSMQAVVVIALIAVAMPVFLPRIRLGGVLIILFFCLLFHRILGFLVAFAIRMLMRKSGEGTFNIHIAWIAFRFGFDMNQIEIHGIEVSEQLPLGQNVMLICSLHGYPLSLVTTSLLMTPDWLILVLLCLLYILHGL